MTERLLAALVRAEDPAAALNAAIEDPDISPELRDALRHVDPEGLATAALLVASLRFERLIQGSLTAAQWFERDPAGFSATFRRYHQHVCSTAHFPAAEAKLFEGFIARTRADAAVP